MHGIPRPAVPDDLTRVVGAGEAALGDAIWVAGQVTERNCRPVAGARVEIWQACATGRYAHPRDGNPAALDPHFGYFGYAITDTDGRYLFKTVKPGPYPAGGSWVRPSHIHFRVDGPRLRRLTTQMYFAGDPYQERDSILNSVPVALRRKVVIEPARHPEHPQGPENYFRFDLTLNPA
jgi:protocatechuate 3,4-dioxygenase beta subunit